MSGETNFADERDVFANAARAAATQAMIEAEMAAKSSNAAITCVPGSMTSKSLLAANPNRQKARIFNDSSTVLLVACSTASASPTNFTERVAQSDTWPVPDGYTGPVQGMWTSDPVSGCAMVTEFS